MTDTQQSDPLTDQAEAELADAMDSITSTGEDWRSRERGIESDRTAADPDGNATDTADEEIAGG